MERIGDYLVRRLVGEGGMGKVYEATERLSGRRVALKVLRPELSRSDDARRLFLNEMAILARLDHPNIVRCLASSEADQQLVMVLEYLEGRTLRELLLDRGALEPQLAIEIAAQIVSGLAAAHHEQIVHRDLKPENVMITKSGVAKVTDFGIAKVLAAHNATTHSLGTLAYMSPEQIDASAVDARSDLYGVGLLLYEMLAGTLPFAAESPRELCNLQCSAEPPPFSEKLLATVPPAVSKLVFELLAKAPEDRPASADDVSHELAPHVSLSGAASSRQRTLASVKSAAAPTDDGKAESTQSAQATTPSARPQRAGQTVMRNDTIAVIERLRLPREVKRSTAVFVIIALSLLAGLATYAVRKGASAPPDPNASARTNEAPP